MANAEVNINRLERNHTMTVKVNITRKFRLRVAIAITLIKAAALVHGCGIKIKDSEAY
jgi:peptidoglycan hydrolase-like amidase